MFTPRLTSGRGWVGLVAIVGFAVPVTALPPQGGDATQASKRYVLMNRQGNLANLVETIPVDTLQAYQQQAPIAEGSDAGPRGTCNTAYHSSTLGTQYISNAPAMPLIEFLDDIELASAGRQLCSIEVTMFGATAVTVPYTVTCTLYTDCPATDGAPGPGTVIATANATVAARNIQNVVFNFPARPTIPDARPGVPSCDGTVDCWMGIFVDGTNPNDNAGPVLRTCTPATPEIGCSDDVFGIFHHPIQAGDEPDGCNYILVDGGCSAVPPATPAVATLVAKVLTAGGAVTGACCDLLLGQCSVQAADNCQGQLQKFFPAQATCPIPDNGCTACGNITPTGTSENEPTCSNEYNDTTNSGCNSTPPTFGAINCGQTINGKSGTFTLGGDDSRDTDWFRLTLANATTVSLFVESEFNFNAGIYTDPNNDCNFDNLVAESTGTGAACQPLNLSGVSLTAGDHYVVIAPASFTGVTCGREYNLTVNCGGTSGQGACCTGNTCTTQAATACQQAGGTYRGDGSTCTPNPCTTPPTCSTCAGDADGNGTVSKDDIPSLVTKILAGAGSCADVNADGRIDGGDIPTFIGLALASSGAGTPCGAGGLTRCDAGGDNTCPTQTNVLNFCLFQVQQTVVPGRPTCVGGPLNAFEQICIRCATTGGGCFNSQAGAVLPFEIAGQNCAFNGLLLTDNCIDCGPVWGVTKRFR